MEFDLTALKASGKFEADFSGELLPGERLADLEGYQISGPIRVQGHLSLLSYSCVVDCDITYTLSGECFRCLEPANREYDCSFTEEFTSRPSEDSYTYFSNRLVIDSAVEDAILLSLPTVFTCTENCKGLCPVCGKNKNASACACESDIEK
ncbi:MAG: DUF177 domain-containing protein [Clostridia bacterium]|nr:DUF177 domain-containing protein [Clostridia bacterium]